MTNLQVICPECSTKGDISISSKAVKDGSSGLLAISVPQHTICNHSFIVYLDKNLNIRDYFMADFLLELPRIVSTEHINNIIFTEEKLTDLSLVKFNLSISLMTYIIRLILSKKKIVLISNEPFMNSLIHEFFEIITQDNFSFNIAFITEEEYFESTNKFTEFMVFKGNKIINNPNNFLNIKDLKIEKNIVHNFLSEIEFDSSILLLRNEFQKAYLLSNSILEQVRDVKHVDRINVSKLVKILEKKHNIKISDEYFEFILNIVRQYFGFNVPSALESFFKLL